MSRPAIDPQIKENTMHQIGNTFTRLAPGIEFLNCTDPSNSAAPSSAASSGDPTADTSAQIACVLGEPRKKFAAVHSSAIVNAWYDKLQASLTEPVQLEQRKGHRRVGVLGTAIFDFASDSLLTVYTWDFDENDRVMLAELLAHTVAIQGTPYQALWMDRYKLGALRAIQQRHPGQVALCRAYVAWAQTELAARLWTSEVQERVRYQIAIALDLDMWAVALANQIQLTSLPKHPMRALGYNHAIRFRQGFETLQQEAPQLIALYALMAQEIGDGAGSYQVTEMMPAVLKSYGVMPASWRLLCRAGTDWLKEFLAYYDFERDTPVGITADILVITQAFGTDQLVPPWLLHAFMQLGGNPNAPRSNYTKRLDDMFALCKRLGQLAAQADEASLAVLKARALEIWAWASDHFEHLPEGYARRATLQGLIRKVDEQQRVDALRRQGEKGWQVPYQLNLNAQEAQAVILDSPLAIWQEGKDMRHCADKFIRACGLGGLVMVSLRPPQGNRSLATVTFDVRKRQVALHKISGFANSLVGPEVLQMAHECQRQLQQQRNKMKLQQPEAA
jgi:hypothetical protein